MPSADAAITLGALTVPATVNRNNDFNVSIDFSGDPADPFWIHLRDGLHAWEVEYYAESVGPGPDEVSLGIVTGACVAGQDSYAAPDTERTVAATTLQDGLYLIGAILRFTDSPGATGFAETVPIQVYTAP